MNQGQSPHPSKSEECGTRKFHVKGCSTRPRGLRQLGHLLGFMYEETDMITTVEVTALERSSEGSALKDMRSFRVVLSDGVKNVVIEARIPAGTLETCPDPRNHIEDFFKNATSLPLNGSVLDIP
jgi:hypothetical protein